MSVIDREAVRQPELVAVSTDLCASSATRRPAPISPSRSSYRAPYRLRPPRPSDTSAVLAMLGRCSTSSRFHRFHGPGDGIAYTVAQLRRRDDVVFLAWEADRCVGMGVLAGPSNLDLHLGVLIEDQRQRQGVGAALVTALISEARSRGVRSIHADVMGEDHQLVVILGRVGKTTARVESGIFSVDIDLCRSA